MQITLIDAGVVDSKAHPGQKEVVLLFPVYKVRAVLCQGFGWANRAGWYLPSLTASTCQGRVSLWQRQGAVVTLGEDLSCVLEKLASAAEIDSLFSAIKPQ